MVIITSNYAFDELFSHYWDGDSELQTALKRRVLEFQV